MNGYIDLHMHSSASDGTLTPTELAEECFRLNVKYCALTDHDTISGQEEFLSAAKRLGIKAVSGIEFNVAHPIELHILGYDFDIKNERFISALAGLGAERKKRAAAIVEKLVKSGYDISFERVCGIAGDGVIGRPHIAMALVEKGYVKDIDHAFAELLDNGKPGYLKRKQYTPEEAIELIRSAGGKAVLAHPGCMEGEDHVALLERLCACGLFGVEAFHSDHTDEQCEYFSALAKRFGLFMTMGSDTHGSKYNEKFPGGEKRGIDKVAPTLKIFMNEVE